MYARAEVWHFRLDCVEGTEHRDAVDDNLVPDFILPKTGCCRYVGSDDFLNGKAVGFEDGEGRNIVFGDNLDVVVGCELYCGNKRLLNCRVDSIVDSKVIGIVYSKVIGIVWECCAISLNNNSAVAFVQNRGRRLLILRGGRERGRGCSGSFLGSGKGRERYDRPLWCGGGGGFWWWLALKALEVLDF